MFNIVAERTRNWNNWSKSPANIPTPGIVGSFSTTSHIQVNKADETNGPISCYLVIGGKKGSKQYRDSYTWMEIQNMKTNSNSSSYCVAVLPRFNEKNLQLGLSSTTTTQCKVDTSHTISCTNKLMSSGITYKFQVVTLSLADGVYLTQTSQPIVATPLASLPSTSKTVTIAIVVALCTLVVLAAAYFFGKRRCDCLKQSTSQKVEFVQPEQALQQDGTNCEEAYVNLEVEQKPKLNKTSYELSPRNSSIQDGYVELNLMIKNTDLSIPNTIFVNRCKEMLCSNDFKKQFQELTKSTDEIKLTKTHAELPENKKKNRYRNILPYDCTRVVLRGTNTNHGYINANYIDGYCQKHKFIATQGPMDGTTGDFWKMIWQQECLVIVMLTNTVEAGKRKCAKYWPEQGQCCMYDVYNVETVKEVDCGSYVLRTIHIEETKNEYATVLRKIQQFQYKEWLDEDVPVTTTHLIQMQKQVNTSLFDGKQFPIVVHCSAGAGRTGVYIGLDILLNETKSKDKVNVFRTVLNMRRQRMDMVQNLEQYIFLHKILSECNELGNTELK
ncbi:putative receptor-type tyrosine-protein phosphatase mosPTP-1 isoform X5 [Ciona intestinalis]